MVLKIQIHSERMKIGPYEIRKPLGSEWLSIGYHSSGYKSSEIFVKKTVTL